MGRVNRLRVQREGARPHARSDADPRAPARAPLPELLRVRHRLNTLRSKGVNATASSSASISNRNGNLDGCSSPRRDGWRGLAIRGGDPARAMGALLLAVAAHAVADDLDVAASKVNLVYDCGTAAYGPVRWFARRSASAARVRLGFAAGDAGKTELSQTNRLS